jgi:MoaA/NifB/PqqE/SkfB family radical SAM enzyme
MRRLNLAEVEKTRRARGRSVLLFITDRCPVGCEHCSVDSRADSPTISDFDLFEQIVDGICARPEVQVVGISGGEPFVERRGLMLASRRVVDSGKDLVLYTSGVWGKSAEAPAWIREVIGLASCVFLSTDAFHADQIADEHFVRAAHTISREDVPMVVQVLDRPEMVERAQGLLVAAFGASWPEHAEINLIPPLPYGRGQLVFMRKAGRPGREFRPCAVAAAPVIRYDGRLAGCCNENVIMGGGPEVLRRTVHSQEEVDAAIVHFGTDPFLGAIGGVGPEGLTEHPRFRDLGDEPFTSICELCWKMLERTAGDERPDPMISALDLVGQGAGR